MGKINKQNTDFVYFPKKKMMAYAHQKFNKCFDDETSIFVVISSIYLVNNTLMRRQGNRCD